MLYMIINIDRNRNFTAINKQTRTNDDYIRKTFKLIFKRIVENWES